MHGIFFRFSFSILPQFVFNFRIFFQFFSDFFRFFFQLYEFFSSDLPLATLKKKESEERRIEVDNLKRKAKEKWKTERRRKLDEARNYEVLLFEFNRVVLGNDIYCGKCYRKFTST